MAIHGANRTSTAYHRPRPFAQLKIIVGKQEEEKYNAYNVACAPEKPSLDRYLHLTDGKPSDYVALGMHTRQLQTFYSRLQMGFRCLSEVIYQPDGDIHDKDTT